MTVNYPTNPMPIGLTAGRPVAAQTASLPVSLIAESPVETDSTDTISFRVSRENIDPPNFTIASVTTTNGSPTISATSLAGLRVGDAITSSNISGNVNAVDLTANPNTATISANASGSGSVTITVNPPEYDVALYDVVATHRTNAGDPNLYVTLEIFQYRGVGSLNSSGKDAVTTESGTKVGTLSMTVNLDEVLTTVRVPRA